MQYWLFKTEPNDYSFDDLLRDKKTVWDGVGNNTALMHMRNVKKGDSVFVYHTGKDKHIAGIASVVRGPYPDPKLDDEKRIVVDIKAVKGVPDDKMGEEIKAYVVLKPGETATVDEIMSFAREGLAAYKYPRYIEFRSALPMTATGKILKRELVDQE